MFGSLEDYYDGCGDDGDDDDDHLDVEYGDCNDSDGDVDVKNNDDDGESWSTRTPPLNFSVDSRCA